jgi:hypothetical protein
MRKLIAAGVAALSVLTASAAHGREIEGRIYEYACGDNCYLTILDKFNKKHTGLCTARECEPWNAAAKMPRWYIGRKAVVTLGRGVQLDGNGDIVGHMTAFKLVRFR